jgi:FtsH-binding integral membrane protein
MSLKEMLDKVLSNLLIIQLISFVGFAVSSLLPFNILILAPTGLFFSVVLMTLFHSTKKLKIKQYLLYLFAFVYGVSIYPFVEVKLNELNALVIFVIHVLTNLLIAILILNHLNITNKFTWLTRKKILVSGVALVFLYAIGLMFSFNNVFLFFINIVVTLLFSLMIVYEMTILSKSSIKNENILAFVLSAFLDLIIVFVNLTEAVSKVLDFFK